MRAGRLDKRVTIERQGAAVDNLGQSTGVWSQISSRRATITPMKVDERTTAGAEFATATDVITIRYDATLADLTTKDRVIWGVHTYNIKSVINVMNKNEQLQLICEEMTGG